MFVRNKRTVAKLGKIAIVLLAVYVLVCSGLFLFQEKLIFPSPKLSEDASAAYQEIDNIEDVELKMKDGNNLRGWFIHNSDNNKSNLLLYFGANAEEVSLIIPKMAKFQNWSVALINYRGYGKSDGIPNEQLLFSDSLEIYDYFSSREDVNKSNIIVMGRSIGTGVATYLSEKRDAAATVLVSPFDSLSSVIKEKCPVLPVNLILKNKFDSLSRAPLIKSPLLIITGTEDKLIPVVHSKKLGDSWGGEVTYKSIIGEGHNSIDDVEEYWNIIDGFLNEKETSANIN